jgi:hypothetical protein
LHSDNHERQKIQKKLPNQFLQADRGDSAGKIGLRNPKLVLIPKMISARPRQLKNGVGAYATKIK